MGMKGTEGEIVQVEGGHIVRSTGRKDRHSKVYTSKGPRDRRVRLSAHTAIQFYDVQDRLGYDRPSKAVDWLIKKAKSSIDKLAELPPWQPSTSNNNAATEAEPNMGSSEMAIQEQSESSGYSFQIHRQLGDHNANNDSTFMSPPPLDTDAIADTIKSFFPTSTTASAINFQNYPAGILTRSANPTEDLGLSLHTAFQDPGLIHGQSRGNASHTASADQTPFAGSAPVGFDSSFQRMLAWNNETSAETRGTGGFLFNSSSLSQQAALAFRGPLQSSFTQSVRAWDDIPVGKTHEMQQSSVFGMPAGFNIPARIHGQDHHQHSNRPSSSSPNNSHR